mgnify:CR=1 FL=1
MDAGTISVLKRQRLRSPHWNLRNMHKLIKDNNNG